MLTKHKHIIPVLLSGIVTGLCIYNMLFWLVWVALIPFFVAVHDKSKAKAFVYGLLYGLIEGAILFFWMVDATRRYTGTETLLGILLLVIAMVYRGLFPAFFALIFSYVTTQTKKLNPLLCAATAASIWVVMEWININTLTGIPWVKYTLGFTQVKQLYGLQWAAITGQLGISFAIVFVNMVLAIFIEKKNHHMAITGIACVFLFYVIGYALFSISGKEEGKRIRVAMLQENIKAETKWNKDNGDALAGIFFDLNQEAAKNNPDLIVWSETALPWTFAPDDHLIQKALQITYKSKASHIIGMLGPVEANPNRVYNSAYYIEPDGKITNRYNKIELLYFTETPLLSPSLKIPFLSDGIHTNMKKGNHANPMVTPHGKIGILICNETIMPHQSRARVRHGADFLVNLSNDAWQEGTRLIDHHFYYARMRAVETGRDIVVNSNRGHGGIFRSNGILTQQNISDTGMCIYDEVTLRKNKTIYIQFGEWTVYIGIIFIFIYLYIIKRRRNHYE